MVSRFTTTSSCPFPVLSSLAVVYDEEVKKKRCTSTRNTYILLALKSILHSFTTETHVDISYVFWTAILTTVQPVLSHTLVASSRTPTLAAVYTSHKRTIFYPAMHFVLVRVYVVCTRKKATKTIKVGRVGGRGMRRIEGSCANLCEICTCPMYAARPQLCDIPQICARHKSWEHSSHENGIFAQQPSFGNGERKKQISPSLDYCCCVRLKTSFERK